MKKTMMLTMCLLILCPLMAFAAPRSDKAGCEDHPLFPSRMPDYLIEACRMQDFAAYDFMGKKGKKNRQEGKFTFITYTFNGPRSNEPSGLAVVRNYENAFKKIGGTIVETDPDRWVNGKIVKNGQETWFEAHKGNGKIWLRIIEKQAMAQDVVADERALLSDLNTAGHTAVYGIFFDTGKATIKPESDQAIAQIAKLLKAEPGMKIFVVGHTDNEGSVDSNVKLSKDRGEAVLKALVQDHDISAGRLKSYGCGQFSPVASNDTDEGRAKNRRVELVKQ